MSMDFRGRPLPAGGIGSEQNNAFSDHYLEVPLIFPRCSSSPRQIPSMVFPAFAGPDGGALPSPVIPRRKRWKCPRHLYPQTIKEHGIQREQLVLPEKVLRDIIRLYTKESGVRNLERQLAAICRKSARELVGGKSKTVRVTGQNLRKFLGVPKYRYGMAEEEDRIGVATGLAWTEVGGDLLSIEVTVVKGKGNLILTGKLGEVMRESAQAGVSYIRSRAKDLGIEEEFYEKFDLHIHVPEGAIPKDGPSAGITMATAVISALTNRPVHKDVAMTGEITLRGRVLPIGGLKEKVLAAHRAGIQRIIIPRENEKDLEEIPPQVARKLRFILVIPWTY